MRKDAKREYNHAFPNKVSYAKRTKPLGVSHYCDLFMTSAERNKL